MFRAEATPVVVRAVPREVVSHSTPTEQRRVAHRVVGGRRAHEERPVAVAAGDVLGVVEVGEGIAERLGPAGGIEAPTEPQHEPDRQSGDQNGIEPAQRSSARCSNQARESGVGEGAAAGGDVGRRRR